MIAMSSENAGSRHQSARRPNVAKPYRALTLVKGPMLSVITSATNLIVVSGATTG
jgi:hypothetical protein